MRAVCACVLVLALPAGAWAQGINTDVALPVAAGQGIWRSQLRFERASGDPSPADRDVRMWTAPQTLLVGITPRLTALATLPVLAQRRTRSDSNTLGSDPAAGDLTLLGRYTLWQDDYAPLATRRAAILAGVKFPTGPDRFGTATFDPILGGVATWAADRHEIDVDGLYSVSTRRNGFRQGGRLRFDLAYRYRLWPRRFGARLLQLNGLLEVNGQWSDRNQKDGRRIADSGGRVLFLAPGVQLAAKDWILEASLQVPIEQDLRGSRVEQDLVAVLGVRVPFWLPF